MSTVCPFTFSELSLRLCVLRVIYADYTDAAGNRTIRAESFSSRTAANFMKKPLTTTPKYASLPRRFAAMFYDSLLLVAVLIFATVPVIIVTHGEATNSGNPFVGTWLFMVSFLFFAWFWTHGGQTLGMHAWKIRLQRDSERAITLWQALLRFMTGLPAWIVLFLGIFLCGSIAENHLPEALQKLRTLPWTVLIAPGVLWLIIDHWPNSWRDRFTQTQVIDIRTEKDSAKTPK